MKVQLIASQKSNNNLQIAFEANINKNNYSKILGTLCNELFGYMTLAKRHRIQGFKCNDVTDIRLVIGNDVLDTAAIVKSKSKTADVLKMMRAKLKLRHQAKAKADFAKLLYDVFDYMTRDVEQIGFEQLVERLMEQHARQVEGAKMLKAIEA